MNRCNESYRQILKSTSIIGGASVINILLRIVRTKFLAVLLGPSGIGLLGIYHSITEMVGTIAGMGVHSSGVRQIAKASGTGNGEKVARTIFALRRVALFLGVFGMVLLGLLSSLVSRLTFGNTDYASVLILLSVITLLETVMAGQMALIQGMRKIGDLAKLNVLSAFFGTILSIPILYILGQKGIVPFLISASAVNTLTAWWYARKIKVVHVQMNWAEVWTEIKPLLNLGFAVMASVLMGKALTWLSSVLIVRRFNLEGVGLYQAATTLSTIYVGFILDAMLKDYLPRLTAIADDKTACNELVNQQAEVGILLSVPGILATLTFAPWMIQLFYSANFIAAFEVLRWQILGSLLLVASWPMHFLMEAKGWAKLYFSINLLKNVFHLGLIWVGVSYLGLIGAGIAYFGSYLFLLIIIYGVAKRLIGFAWSEVNRRHALLILPAVGIVFVSKLFLDDFWSLILGSTVTIAVGIYSFKCLVAIISPDGIVRLLVKIKSRLVGIGAR